MPISSPHHQVKHLPASGKIAVGVGALWLLVAAWPLMVAGIYAAVVASSLKGSRSRWLLISAMLIPALLVEVFWVKPAVAWVMPDQKPSTQQQLANKPQADKNVKGAHYIPGQKVKVVQVVDGSTIDVDADGQVYRVKLLGVIAPAVATGTASTACFGQESSAFLDGVVRNKTLYLQEDAQSTKLDSQGNLLRYVLTQEGIAINLLMLDSGLATTTTEVHSQQSEYLQAVETAKFNKKGMWAVCDTISSSQTVLGASTSATPQTTTKKPTYSGKTVVSPVPSQPLAKPTVTATPLPTSTIQP